MFSCQSSIFFLVPLLISFLLIILSLFVISKNPRSLVNLSFSFIILCAAIWLFSYAKAYQTTEVNNALRWFKLGYLGIIFLPILYYQFVNNLLQINRKPYILILLYICGLTFGTFVLKTNIIINGLTHYSWGYYPKAGSKHLYFLIFFLGLINMASYNIFYYLFLNKQTTNTKKEQLKYVLLAFTIFAFASIDFLPNYGVNVYPIGFIPTTIFLIIICYSIIRHKLLDIKLAVTRLGIFITVYSLILGVPFEIVLLKKEWLIYIAGVNWFWIPMILLSVLATTGPTIYLYIQKRAEDKLLQEQHRYQATLRQASAGMGKIKDLKKLLNMIVYVLTNAVQIEHATVYIYNKSKKQYDLGASRKKNSLNKFVSCIDEESELVIYLSKNKNSIIYDEIKQKSEESNDLFLLDVSRIIFKLDGALVAPIFIDQNLTAFIVMGKKQFDKIYNQDDIGVFSILANQTALAIENALFYEQMNVTHQQLYQAEKMATIGTMADGLSHQINNRFHALGFIAGDALDTIQMSKGELSPEKMKEILGELERSFVRVQENVIQGGEIVQGLLKYTRKGDAGFAPIDIDAVLKAAIEMAQFKIKTNELKIIREYDVATMPKIKANFTQLQEVFFNLTDNGYDAMMQRKTEKKEPGYQPTLIVRVTREEGQALIVFEDNGIGVKEEDMHKLFTPFFTTKLSSKKGTGLGLYVIRKIVEDNHGGKVEMVSKYMHGTQMKLRLPIAIE